MSQKPNNSIVSINIYDGLTLYYKPSILSKAFQEFIETHYQRVKDGYKFYPEETMSFEVNINEDIARKWEGLSESQKQTAMYWFNELIWFRVQTIIGG